MKPRREVDVLIVTALQVERRAVRTHLRNLQTLGVGSCHPDIGTFDKAGGDLRVAIIEVGAGNVNATALTSNALRDLQPSVVLIVGIAGGLKDVMIGDVVASSKVYWAESSKAVDGGVNPRPDFGPVSNRLVQTSRSIAINDGWRIRAADNGAGKRLGGGVAHAIVAPIVVVEQVVADIQSEIAQMIRNTFGDAVAVDMEDFGVLKAVAVDERVSAIAVRAISDLLDNKEQADALASQPLAAANAAAFAFELLSLLDIGMNAFSAQLDTSHLVDLASTLYPLGPFERNVWMRAGGDASQISLSGPGKTQWWAAIRELQLGGGGGGITPLSLVAAMHEDFPNHPALQRNSSP